MTLNIYDDVVENNIDSKENFLKCLENMSDKNKLIFDGESLLIKVSCISKDKEHLANYVLCQMFKNKNFKKSLDEFGLSFDKLIELTPKNKESEDE